jgi:[lysine-biosynthesis-protein LysW]--L-2-aminoadipate ligase
MAIAMVHGRIRPEEKLLIEAAARLSIDLVPVSDSQITFDLDGGLPYDTVLIRSVSTSRGITIARACEAAGVPVHNSSAVANVCSDKAATSWALRRAGVPTPETRVAFTPESALDALDQLGYPAVIKPVNGSWARMVCRVRDRAEAEQILEHRAMLPNPWQHIYYMQEYVDTTQADATHQDVRAFVIGDQTIAAIHRQSHSWITNTARGATTQNLPITAELDDICVRAAQAVGGGILAIDLLTGPEGWLVHEVNHTMEFRNSVGVTDVDIPGLMLSHVQTSLPLVEVKW